MRKVFFVIAVFFASSCSQKSNDVVTGQENKPMPCFGLLLMDSTSRLNTKDIPQGETTVFFSFNPYCPYCRAETESIISNAKKLRNIHFYMISNFPFQSIRDFYNLFHLKDCNIITVAQDYSDAFGHYYHVPAVPYLAIYDKHKDLIKAMVGMASTKAIEEALVK